PATSYGSVNPVTLTNGRKQAKLKFNARTEHTANKKDINSSKGTQTPQKRFSKHMGTLLLALLALVAMLAAVVSFFYLRGVEVPNLVQMEQQKAIDVLDDLGLQYDIHEIVADNGVGLVLATNPKAGEYVAHNGRITLDVAVERLMPDVIGLTQESAQKKLQEVGHNPENVHVKLRYSEDAQGSVLESNVAAGEAITSTTDIQLIVATRPKIPDVVGLTQEEAQSALEEMSLRAKIEWKESEEPAYKVLSCDPKPGTIVQAKSEVELVVSSPGPGSLYEVLDYLGTKSSDISAYMAWKKFSVGGSGYDQAGGWEQYWAYSDEAPGLYVWFTPHPFSADASLVHEGESDIMKDIDKAPLGVRMTLGSGEAPTQETIDAYMKKCGLSGQKSLVTYDTMDFKNVKKPKGVKKMEFICASGAQSGYGWHILVVDGTVVVGAASEQIYETSAQNYGNWASMAAAAELF
ncbi:MAG: PASTA domain-containing protein, partial [Eggerthellaceae bacterium]|nr:PASTA domain-containing protein [Eggerthellaceae bacterium]